MEGYIRGTLDLVSALQLGGKQRTMDVHIN